MRATQKLKERTSRKQRGIRQRTKSRVTLHVKDRLSPNDDAASFRASPQSSLCDRCKGWFRHPGVSVPRAYIGVVKKLAHIALIEWGRRHFVEIGADVGEVEVDPIVVRPFVHAEDIVHAAH